MGVAISDDGIIIGANIDVSRIQQAASKMKSLMDDFVNSTAKSVQKADQELERPEKTRKNGRSSPPRKASRQPRRNWTD